MATHTGVYYKSTSTGNIIHLATTCNDRSIDLQTPHNEEIATIHKSGAYNGVHSIKILDLNNVICALYDGNAIHLKFETNSQTEDLEDDDFFEETAYNIDKGKEECSRWLAKNVKKIHKNWVRKICDYKYEKWNEKNQNIITCSYDKTVMMTNFKSNDSPHEIIHGNKTILDFYISSFDGSIWAISESAIYHSRLVDGKWECDLPILTEEKYFRSITENVGEERNNDIPLIFYNKGNGTDGFLGKISEGKVELFRFWQ